jgi:ATP-grasp domain, R2K clade family 3
MQTTWLIQTNVTADSPTANQLRHACAAAGLASVGFVHPPGVRCPPDIPAEYARGPIVFHARSSALLGALGTVWESGVFFSPESFCHKAYSEHYGSEYINSEARVMAWGELVASHGTRDEYLFIKPVDDYKGFTGHSLNAASLAVTFGQLRLQDPRVNENTEIVVAPAVEVDAEWRCFIVDDEVISASMYRPVGDSDVPSRVLDFARSVARGWSPARVYVLDIGQVHGRLKIVECNCFNASRFYCADVGRVVIAVSEYQSRHFSAT